jgi:hypothetical protein
LADTYKGHAMGRVAVMKSIAWMLLLALLALIYGAAMFIPLGQ